MATFIKGVAPISYKPVVFDLDFAYMERMLKMRQNMYNKGASKVKNLYDSLFSSSMLRDDNIAKRDAYLKTISESLKASSGLDFSLDQNVHNATRLFEPINNDPYLVKDIAYTKNLSTEMSKAQRLKSSSNPEDRKQYWAEGIKALQYQAEEFKSASKDETLGMSAPKYVPNMDLLAMADKLYKDGKISVKKDVVKGGYIWTMKNGDIVYPVTQTMVSTMFAQDPAIKEMFKTQAYVKRKDYIKQHAAEFGGDESKAEAAYMEQVLKDVVNKNRLELYQQDDEVNGLMEEVQQWEELGRQGKILQGSDEEKKYLAAVEKLKVAGDALAQKKLEITIQEVNDLNDITAMRSAVDGAVTMDSYNTLAQLIARYLADKNKETSIKVDPIYLADLRAENARQMEEIRHQNRKIMAEIQQINRKEIIDKKEENIRTRPSKSKTIKKKPTKPSDLFTNTNPYPTPDSTAANPATTTNTATNPVTVTPSAASKPKVKVSTGFEMPQ